MIQFLKTLLLYKASNVVKEKMKSGYRVMLWKWERGQCNCEETIIYVNIQGGQNG